MERIHAFKWYEYVLLNSTQWPVTIPLPWFDEVRFLLAERQQGFYCLFRFSTDGVMEELPNTCSYIPNLAPLFSNFFYVELVTRKHWIRAGICSMYSLTTRFMNVIVYVTSRSPHMPLSPNQQLELGSYFILRLGLTLRSLFSPFNTQLHKFLHGVCHDVVS